MKTKIVLLCLISFSQFTFGQNENRKSLHGQFTNESALVDNGYVFNLNSKTRTFISNQGFFDVLAKAKDTLLVLSPAFKSKKIVLQDKDFAKPLFVVLLEAQTTLLKEVIVKGKTDIKPAIGNSQELVDIEFIDDAKSSPINRTLPLNGTIENGMDFVRIFKMVSKIFKKDVAVKEESNTLVDFSDSVSRGIDRYFFTNTLKLKSEEIALFLDYCESDPKSKTLLKQQDEFMLIDFLITKNEEFKRITTFEK
ncbi:hypothetical protein SAMN05444395_103184 [Flavobacterium fryxellicola]|uniref:DUF4476 domain-containing protein n=1 Tax=Flavobacterium fryxellicola TaxID=249352 RepID=A0A167X3L2_9FLAO|nr:hypothetical protein [Flavobacterium fryxellicola]OAB27998.1 hypothetical protein FBFR_09080 [Flavobacterium fryxellicola]SHN64999.1 hypothetical protein SAMN05444395_103184 [Flavobacterium fryxellicola]